MYHDLRTFALENRNTEEEHQGSNTSLDSQSWSENPANADKEFWSF